MDEFYRIWCEYKDAYGLEREVHKSIYDDFWMKIYRDGHLIIKELADNELTLYEHATLALIRYVRSHEAF